MTVELDALLKALFFIIVVITDLFLVWWVFRA